MSAPRIWAAAFYWIGVVMTTACVATVLAGNTELFHRFEHTGFPLSWAFAGIAAIAFLATEICNPGSSRPSEAEEESLQYSPEFETVER
jgi:hypothetical protein